jgi:hypothetical protein
MNEETGYLASLNRAFTVGRADYVEIDGHSSEFLRKCTNWALGQGILRHDPDTSESVSDSQWTVLAYRLTDHGKQTLGVQ